MDTSSVRIKLSNSLRQRVLTQFKSVKMTHLDDEIRQTDPDIYGVRRVVQQRATTKQVTVTVSQDTSDDVFIHELINDRLPIAITYKQDIADGKTKVGTSNECYIQKRPEITQEYGTSADYYDVTFICLEWEEQIN